MQSGSLLFGALLLAAAPVFPRAAHAQNEAPMPPAAKPPAPAPERPPPAPKVVGQRIYPRLAPVRENLAVLQTPVCVFVGYFPGDEHAWVTELCYDQKVVQLGDRVTFCRHRRRAVRDLDETFLRARGLPRPQAWEGILVLGPGGEAVGRLETPVRPARLARLLREALQRGQGVRSTVWQNARSPRFHLALGKGVSLSDLEPARADLDVSVASAGQAAIRVTLRSERVGPKGRRGERMALREVARRRFLRDQLGKGVHESTPEHPAGAAVLWWYRLREPEAGVRARAVAIVRWNGDLVTVSAGSKTRDPAALRAAVWKVAARVRPGGAPDR